MNKVVENLEWMGYSRESIKGIGMSFPQGDIRRADKQESPISVKLPFVGPGKLVSHYVTPSYGMTHEQTASSGISSGNSMKRE